MRYRDGNLDFRSSIDADNALCNQALGSASLVCDKPWQNAARGEVFGYYWGRPCHRRRDNEPTMCDGGGTSGLLTFLNNRYFSCE